MMNSESMTVRDVTVSNHGPNTDGLNPNSCRDVIIVGCMFDTGDDCIAINSGMNEDGGKVVRKYRYKKLRHERGIRIKSMRG